jgi:3-methyladenine DNA glycosylase AlkC
VTPQKADHSEVVLWKDHLDEKKLSAFAADVKKHHVQFDAETFIRAVLGDRLLDRELKDRFNTIARHLRAFLPEDYKKAIAIVVKCAPHTGMWENLCLVSFVEQFGLDDFATSVKAMEQLTQYSSCEFTIRPYLIKDPDYMLPVIHRWAQSNNEHVRRLAAEGTRPRGVWMPHIPSFREDPNSVLEVLEKLKADESLYVRKAVANNLNDISKDHPKVVIRTALRWQKDKNRHTDWIIKHACRSLIKQGHPEVFGLFGFTYPPKVALKSLSLKPKGVKTGGELSFSFTLESEAKTWQKLAVDYVVHYVKKNGKTSPKVFKLTEKPLPAGETLLLAGKRSFEMRTTRKLYPGNHRLEIMVNGIVLGGADFVHSVR